jgi:gamma-glutamylaminecyclotransferase
MYEAALMGNELDAVFVYGTLKMGGPLHHHLNTSELIHVSTTNNPRWHMRSLGAFPAMTPGNGYVRGQVYAVDTKTLQLLDWVEGSPNFFKRERIDLIDWPSPVWAYIYHDHIPPTPEDADKIFTWNLLDNNVQVV